MKQVRAIVRRARVPAVLAALDAAGARGVTVTQVLGHGVQRGVSQRWRLREHRADLLPKSLVMTVVSDENATEVVESVIAAASSGTIGDGKVFVSRIEEAYRIRTGESGPEVL